MPSSKNSDFFRPGAESLSEFDPEMQFQRVTHVRARERLPRCALLQGGVGSSAVNAGSAITVPIISGANAMRRAGYAYRFGGAAESASSVRGMPISYEVIAGLPIRPSSLLASYAIGFT